MVVAASIVGIGNAIDGKGHAIVESRPRQELHDGLQELSVAAYFVIQPLISQ